LLVDEATVLEHPWLKPVQESTVESGLPTALFCPVIWQGEVIGILGFRSIKENAYTDADLQMTALIADRIGGSVANSQTYQTTNMRAK
jgi:GAF domain-containing protein